MFSELFVSYKDTWGWMEGSPKGTRVNICIHVAGSLHYKAKLTAAFGKNYKPIIIKER